ncbi:MAG: SH3 domain-containing protein [Planctomycetes bacterium]|nr:SH3 domain-containing protein [Planctomycetota bacterium]
MKSAATILLPVLTSLAFAQGSQNPNLPAPQSQGASDAITSPKFAVAVSGRLRGFADAASPALRDLKGGEPLVVVGKQGLLYEVEVPGGLTAWLWSAYVKDGKELGTVETIQDGVNLRPMPKSDARNTPIALIRKGQIYTIVQRDKDWVQVVVPSEIHGFVLASEVTITEDAPAKHETEIAAAREWVNILKEKAVKAEAARKAEDLKREEEERKHREEMARESACREKLRQGQELLKGLADEGARARAESYFKSTEELAKDLPPKTVESIAAEIQRGRERIQHLTFVETERRSTEDAMKKEREEKLKEAQDRQKRLEDSYSKIKDPAPVDAFGARFSGMGWMRRETGLAHGRVFMIERGGKLQFYASCPTGRYNLDDFVGREVGLLGKVKQVEGYPARMIEIDQIEILSNN